MPRICGIVNCGNRENRDKKSFFRIPAVRKIGGPEKVELSAKRRDRWISAIKRDDLTETKLKYMWICEDHFLRGKPADLLDVCHPDWVPSINLGYQTQPKTMQRYERAAEREGRKAPPTVEEQSELQDCVLHLDSHLGNHQMTPCDNHVTSACEGAPQIECESESVIDVALKTSVETQTNLTMEDINKLMGTLENYVEEAVQLKNTVKNLMFDESSFSSDNEKTKYYTGVPTFMCLTIIFELVEPYLIQTERNVLSKFQQFLVCLMRLRLNLDFCDLGYRFNVSSSTISRAFYSCLSIMTQRLSRFVFWPERHILQSNVPSAFSEAFGKRVTMVIDCFEVEIERPAKLIARAQTFSNYKQRNTLKFLIGICPQGAICYISRAWGGRVSDKHLTENCGILENLLPGDLILADRGFRIKDSVNLYCCEVKVPAFREKKQQLSAVSLEETRSLASVRIHVERIIGSLRQKYTILQSRLPISLIRRTSASEMSVVDEILITTCALVNLCPSIINDD